MPHCWYQKEDATQKAEHHAHKLHHIHKEGGKKKVGSKQFLQEVFRK